MKQSSANDGLYQATARPLWAYLYSRCCDSELASEGVQEAFLKLQQHGQSLIADPRAWLYSVARNWLNDQLRRNRRRDQEDSLGAADRAQPPDPANIVQVNELHERVRYALTLLNLEDREVLVLRYALDWRSDRIAEALSSTSAAVDMRLCRARRKLAEALASIGVGHEAV